MGMGMDRPKPRPRLRPFPLSPQVAAIAITFLLLLLAIAIFRFFRPRLRHRLAGPRLPANVKRFRYRDLEIATDCFDASHRLGQGGLGIVFKGVLKNGQEVAIKRLDQSPVSSRGEMELQNELLMMSHVNASCPHIVSLLGFSSHGKQKLLLVYEYMEKKSVQEALFDENYPYTLAWEQRFQILLEASRALAFLHGCKPWPIIHGDVKPSNVLLDARFGARLADFGLARFKTHVTRTGFGTGTEPGTETQTETGTGTEEPGPTRGLEEERGASRGTRILVKEKLLEKAMAIMPRKLDEVSHHTSRPGSHLANDSSTAVFTAASPESHESSSSFTAMQASSGAPSAAESFADDIRLDVNYSLNMEDNAHVDATNPLREGSVRGATEPPPPPPSSSSSSSSSVREYVMEWMGHKHKVLIASKDFDAASEASTSTSGTTMSTAKDSGEPRKRSRSSEWWGNMLHEDRDCAVARVEKTEEGFRVKPEDACSIVVQPAPAHETKKKDGRVKSRRWSASFEWCRNDETRECAKPRSREWWKDDEVESTTGGKEWKSRNKKMESSLSCCSDGWSGELGASKGVHTTPSMRGTICYVAPENGSGLVLSEKSDVYSFGVLMLVVVSGRRPLQVMDSPLIEFERANLVSWSRHLAHSGNVLDLVDTSLKGAFDEPQATLCITIALLCLQRLPSMRPSMNEVLQMLLGEMQCPSLPSQLSLAHRCQRTRKPQ